MRIEALVMLLRSLAASVRFICAFGFVLCLHSKLTRNILGFRFNNFIIQRFPFTRISRPVCFSFFSYLSPSDWSKRFLSNLKRDETLKKKDACLSASFLYCSSSKRNNCQLKMFATLRAVDSSF
ncbi:hypothetical protein T07_9308 [Trichinella nelsoni]|uniref:Uncharacterized protein n=1 Tax=Trichinella nelsoni TaxID=6336 RepID=A0A0V0RKJ8_9BILA|nr:hypothetical protein T07_9308 [Trichinella nelsoni]